MLHHICYRSSFTPHTYLCLRLSLLAFINGISKAVARMQLDIKGSAGAACATETREHTYCCCMSVCCMCVCVCVACRPPHFLFAHIKYVFTGGCRSHETVLNHLHAACSQNHHYLLLVCTVYSINNCWQFVELVKYFQYHVKHISFLKFNVTDF